MDDEVTHDAFIQAQPDGRCLAQLLDLAGCFALGYSRQEALASLADAVPPYYAGLGQHDEYTPRVSTRVAVVPREIVAVADARACAAAPFFGPDAAPVSDEDLDWYFPGLHRPARIGIH